MSYYKKIEYEIIPKEAFQIARNCSGCGEKMAYQSTGNFRVNANGNQLDVWLIYQCAKCKHTYNLSIYERVKPTELEQQKYQLFLENNSDAALEYGLNRELFKRNKAELLWEDISYDIKEMSEEMLEEEKEEIEQVFLLHNSYGLKLRADRLAAQLLQASRSQVKKMIKDETLFIQQESGGKIIKIKKVSC